MSGVDHFWRADQGVCLGCGLDLAAMVADVEKNGHPTCDRHLSGGGES